MASASSESPSPRVLVVGHGHAGGSVAEVAARADCTVEIWGRRRATELTDALRRFVLEPHSNVSYRQRDVLDQEGLVEDLANFDWIVLANEPRPQLAEPDEIRAVIEGTTAFYRAARQAGFEGAPHDRSPRDETPHARPDVRPAIVRIGSPPAEQPEAAAADNESAYFVLKQDLEGVAAAHAANGLSVLTVAPSEIHSPFGTYGPDDPYRRAIDELPRMPMIHEVPSAAVSDQTVGEAVLTAAAVGEIGAWYQASDGALGPGAALQIMSDRLGLPAKPLAVWNSNAARHLLDVLVGGGDLNLDLLAEHTTGLDSLLAPARVIRASQLRMASAALWWAPPQMRTSALEVVDRTNRQLAGELIRAVSDQLAPRMLAIIVAMGTDRSDPALDSLEPWFGSKNPTEAERRVRLESAICRQADELQLGR